MFARKHEEDVKVKSETFETNLTAAFDLGKVRPAPHSQTSLLYYSKQLKNHNLTVADISSMETCSFFWNEEDGGKDEWYTMCKRSSIA